MKLIIVAFALMFANCTVSQDNDDTFIGDKDKFDRKYKFHSGKLENETKDGWQIDIELESLNIIVRINEISTDSYQIIENKLFITTGEEDDNYMVIEIREVEKPN